LNLAALVGAFVAPALTAIKVPQATTWFLENAEAMFQNIIDDASDLIKAIPEASVTIIVKVGSVVIYSVKLIAKDVPIDIVVPTFQLSLPNITVDLNIPIPFPYLPPTVIEIPIPVPSIEFPQPLVAVTGGQVQASAEVTPTPIQTSVYIPQV
jgi:hypothetical protein